MKRQWVSQGHAARKSGAMCSPEMVSLRKLAPEVSHERLQGVRLHKDPRAQACVREIRACGNLGLTSSLRMASNAVRSRSLNIVNTGCAKTAPARRGCHLVAPPALQPASNEEGHRRLQRLPTPTPSNSSLQLRCRVCAHTHSRMSAVRYPGTCIFFL